MWVAGAGDDCPSGLEARCARGKRSCALEMIVSSGSAATATVGYNLPISGLFRRQASGGKGGAKRLLNDSKGQTPCYNNSHTQIMAQGRGE
jgi:hypothetical protein